jgi:hypothetical protein
MPAPQTTYAKTMPVAFAGMKGDAGDDQVDSFVNSEAATSIPFGVGVIKGTADNRALLPRLVGDNAKFMGVVLHHHAYAKPYQLDTVGITPKTMMSVISRGRVWVTVEEAVTQNDRAFMRYAAGAGGTQLGAWRKSADTATAVEILGARFITSTSGPGLAMLEINANASRAAI